MYIETSTSDSKQSPAHLESAMYVSSAGKCKLTFWYSMYGQRIGDLTVYIKDDKGVMKNLWNRTGNQGSDWLQVSLCSSYAKWAESSILVHV